MEDREYLIILYEYYGKLLTNKQQSYFEDYYYENLTMEEIAINDNISKNAVSKQLINIKDKLYYYESILKLYYKSKCIKDIIKDNNLLDKINDYI